MSASHTFVSQVDALQSMEMNLLQLARDHNIHNQISAIRAMEMESSKAGLLVFCDKDIAKVALEEVISSLRVHPFVCYEAAWMLPHVGIQKASPVCGGDVPNNIPHGALSSLHFALKTLFAPQAANWLTSACPPPIPAPLHFSFTSALQVHAARVAVISLYKIALEYTSHQHGYQKSLGGVAHACIMALLDASDSSAGNQLDIAPVRSICLFAALASAPQDCSNDRLPDRDAMNQIWEQLMKSMRLDRLISSQSIPSTRCGILGVGQLVKRCVLPLSYKFPDGLTVSQFLLQFLEPSTHPVVAQTACYVMGRLISANITLLLPLIAAGCLGSVSSVRQAGQYLQLQHNAMTTCQYQRNAYELIFTFMLLQLFARFWSATPRSKLWFACRFLRSAAGTMSGCSNLAGLLLFHIFIRCAVKSAAFKSVWGMWSFARFVSAQRVVSSSVGLTHRLAASVRVTVGMHV